MSARHVPPIHPRPEPTPGSVRWRSMKHHLSAATALALCMAACSPSTTDPTPTNGSTTDALPPATSAIVASPAPLPPPPAPAVAKILTLEGLGVLKIGRPVPGDANWSAAGQQASDACITVSSPDYRGAYAIVEEGKVRRISVGEGSDVTLIEGIGVGATERQVMAAFPGFRSTPHKYVDAPAKYLTAPNAESGDPALRFEIGSDRTVTAIHVGTAPTLGYVEGCA